MFTGYLRFGKLVLVPSVDASVCVDAGFVLDPELSLSALLPEPPATISAFFLPILVLPPAAASSSFLIT